MIFKISGFLNEKLNTCLHFLVIILCRELISRPAWMCTPFYIYGRKGPLWWRKNWSLLVNFSWRLSKRSNYFDNLHQKLQTCIHNIYFLFVQKSSNYENHCYVSISRDYILIILTLLRYTYCSSSCEEGFFLISFLLTPNVKRYFFPYQTLWPKEAPFQIEPCFVCIQY